VSKYEPLTSFLESQSLDSVTVTFREIERVLGFKLPPSALEHRPWWANSGGSHVQSKAWLEAGFETESVDMEARRLIFRRVSRFRTPPVSGANAASKDERAKRSFEAVYGCLGGTIRIHGDVTLPVEEAWSAQATEA
jgi:hypothetical protein